MPVWGVRDYKAPFASGSAGWHAMVVVPCSMGTAARIAHGISDTLLTRAADVMLKERRTLVVVPRETPLGLVHLENLTQLARLGRARPAGDAVVLRQARDARRRDRHGGRAHPRPPRARARPACAGGGRDERPRRPRHRRAPGSRPCSRRAGRARSTPSDVARLRARGPPGARRARRSRARRGSGRRGAHLSRRRAAGDDGACVVLPRRGQRAARGSSCCARSPSRASPGPRGVRVRVDWTRCGLELAQVALGFGANELGGSHREQARPARWPRARCSASSARSRACELAELVKRRELEGFVRRAGRTPAFDEEVDVDARCDPSEGRARRAPVVRRRASRSSGTPTSSPSGQLANEVRERLHGDRTYFNRNMRIEVTNVCVASCLFCSFAKLEEGAPGAHTMTVEEAWRELESAHGRPAERDPHRQRPAPRAAVLVLRGAPRRLQAHQARHAHEVLHRGRDPLLRRSTTG